MILFQYFLDPKTSSQNRFRFYFIFFDFIGRIMHFLTEKMMIWEPRTWCYTPWQLDKKSNLNLNFIVPKELITLIYAIYMCRWDLLITRMGWDLSVKICLPCIYIYLVLCWTSILTKIFWVVPFEMRYFLDTASMVKVLSSFQNTE